ncbi:MAG TPA: phage head closure protein [Bacillus bacterium]|nr:phage head closure protein [Bacillus sp. (in: firmicutes)]
MQPFKYKPNLSSGEFRHRIIFQKLDETENTMGDVVSEWVEYKKAWAKIVTVKGREFFAAAAVQNENTVRFIIRYAEEIHTDMRIIYNNRTFEIISVLNDDELNKTLTIMCKEGVK